MSWTVVLLSVAFLLLHTRYAEGFRGACIPFNEEFLGSEKTAKTTPVTAPGDIDGLDLRANDAILELPDEVKVTDLFNQSFTLKFYVQFDVSPPPAKRRRGRKQRKIRPFTFVDIPSVGRLQRRSDGVFVATYDFLNLENETVKRSVALSAGGSYYRNYAGDWIMLCLNFEKRDVGDTMTYYVNGKKITANSGDLSGLFRIAGLPVFQKAAVSSVNIGPLNSNSCMSDDFPACAPGA